jgi:hypothetical protein
MAFAIPTVGRKVSRWTKAVSLRFNREIDTPISFEYLASSALAHAVRLQVLHASKGISWGILAVVGGVTQWALTSLSFPLGDNVTSAISLIARFSELRTLEITIVEGFVDQHWALPDDWIWELAHLQNLRLLLGSTSGRRLAERLLGVLDKSSFAGLQEFHLHINSGPLEEAELSILKRFFIRHSTMTKLHLRLSAEISGDGLLHQQVLPLVRCQHLCVNSTSDDSMFLDIIPHWVHSLALEFDEHTLERVPGQMEQLLRLARAAPHLPIHTVKLVLYDDRQRFHWLNEPCSEVQTIVIGQLVRLVLRLGKLGIVVLDEQGITLEDVDMESE